MTRIETLIPNFNSSVCRAIPLSLSTTTIRLGVVAKISSPPFKLKKFRHFLYFTLLNITFNFSINNCLTVIFSKFFINWRISINVRKIKLSRIVCTCIYLLRWKMQSGFHFEIWWSKFCGKRGHRWTVKWWASRGQTLPQSFSQRRLSERVWKSLL